MALHNVRGHQVQAAHIRTALLGDRPGHAYLLCGASGVGKAFFALQTAKLLLCREEGDDACDVCKPCRQADHDNHPDLHLVEAAEGKRSISIEQIQTLCGRYALRPHGERRIAIVRDADRMTVWAANTLLKTLEEPPPKSVLLLTTSRPYALPETILSRCQMLRFAPLSTQDVADLLSADPEWTPEAVRFAANLADGSVGRARGLLEAGGIELRDHLLDRLRAVRVQDNFDLTVDVMARATQAGKTLEDRRTHLRLMLQLVLRYYRDVWNVQLGGKHARLFHADRIADIHADAERLSQTSVEQVLEALLEAWEQINRNANLRILLESLFFRLGTMVQN